jgi:hypothetical protein
VLLGAAGLGKARTEDRDSDGREVHTHTREEGEVKYLVHYVSLRVSDLGISHEGTCRLTQ